MKCMHEKKENLYRISGVALAVFRHIGEFALRIELL